MYISIGIYILHDRKGGALHALPCDYIVSGHFCSRTLDWLLNTKNAHTRHRFRIMHTLISPSAYVW